MKLAKKTVSVKNTYNYYKTDTGECKIRKIRYGQGYSNKNGTSVVSTTAAQRLMQFADWLERHSNSARFAKLGERPPRGDKKVSEASRAYAEDIRSIIGELNLLRLDVVVEKAQELNR